MSRYVPLFTVFATIVALLGIWLGVKQFTVFHHAEQYRAITAAAADRADVVDTLRARPERPLLGIAEQVAWAPRYYIFYPSFEFADHLAMDLDTAFSFQIVGIISIFLWLMLNLGLRVGAVRSVFGLAVVTILCLSTFALMNGRAAPAFLGYVLLAWTAVDAPGASGRTGYMVFTSLGLLLCTMSTGLFFVAASLYILTNFSPVGTWLRHGPPGRTTWRSAVSKRWVDGIILGIVVAYSLLLIIRLGYYFGWDGNLIRGIATHGMGALIEHDWRQFSVALSIVTILLAAGCVFGLFRQMPKPMGATLHQFAASNRIPVVLLALPLPFVIVGYTGATLSLVGLILIAARVVEMVVEVLPE